MNNSQVLTPVYQDNPTVIVESPLCLENLDTITKSMVAARKAFKHLVSNYSFKTVLDIGCGRQKTHTKAFEQLGKDVLSIDTNTEADPDILGTIHYIPFSQEYDCIWASHVLEHQRDVGRFLDSCKIHLSDNGILAVTVPPAKHNIVGGHLTLWNAGLLCYNLILAGFNCKNAWVCEHEYNISVIVTELIKELPHLKNDHGDINTLLEYFPDWLSHEGASGEMPR